MIEQLGLRDRKKRETRERLADVAAGLFATRGYDQVSMLDVARAADVSEQTLYNYFAAKPELVLDRADEIRNHLRGAVRDRAPGSTPADAIRLVVSDDIGRFVETSDDLAPGEFPALCLESPVLRRFALELREAQTIAITDAILETNPDLHPIIVRAHSAALVSVIQSITDRIGRAVLDGVTPSTLEAGMRGDATIALDDLRDHFQTLLTAERASS